MAKSRKPKLQLSREPARPIPPADAGKVYALTGHLRDTFDAIVCGAALVQNGLIPEHLPAMLDDPVHASMIDSWSGDVSDSATLDGELEEEDDDYDAALDREDELLDAEIDRLGDAVEGIARATRMLARSLIAQALGKPVNVPALLPDMRPVDVGESTLDDFVQRLQLARVPAPIRPSPADLRKALGEVGDLIREVGLEEFDAYCELESGPKGVTALVAEPVSSESAHVALIENLFDRAEMAASVEHPVLMLDRISSLWEFERWSVAPPAGLMPPDLADFPRDVRNDEFRLVDRTLVTLGETVVGQIAGDDGYRELVPRQHRMACAYMESFVDIFEVAEVTGRRSTWRSVLHDTSYEVHDHQDPPLYQVGWIAAGRLIPFDDERHLRSPGTIFLPPDPDLARKAAATFARLEETIHSALALEAAISSDIFGVPVPRDVKPAQSRSSARVILDLVDVVTADGIELDSTLRAFVKALKRQAGEDDSRPGAVASKHAGGRAKKRSKRRRR